MHIFRQFSEDTEGSVLVEFTLIIPVFLLIIATVVEFSTLVTTSMYHEAQARNVARFMARCHEEINLCIENANSLISQDIAAKTITPTTDSSANFTYITVGLKMTAPSSPISSMVSNAPNNSLAVHRERKIGW